MKLDPKALAEAHSEFTCYWNGEDNPLPAILEAAITAYLSNLQQPKEVQELVEQFAKMADDKAAEYEAEKDMWSCAGPIAVRLRGLANDIRAADLLSRMDGEGWRPKVKPLEWKPGWGPDEEGDQSHLANTPFGNYKVERWDGKWKWGYCFDEYYDEEDFECDDLESGKALAEAHWIERISPALAHSIEDPTQGSPAGGMDD